MRLLEMNEYLLGKIFWYCSEEVLDHFRKVGSANCVFRKELGIRIKSIEDQVPELYGYIHDDNYKILSLKSQFYLNSKCEVLLEKCCRDRLMIQLDKIISMHENASMEMKSLIGQIDFGRGLLGACRGGWVDLVELMVEYGAREWTEGMIVAIKEQKVQVIEWLLSNDVCDQLDQYNIDVIFALEDHWNTHMDQSPVFKVIRSYNPDLADEVNFEIEISLFRRAADICGDEFDSEEFYGGYLSYV